MVLAAVAFASEPGGLSAERSFYLDELIRAHDYRPAKNSFLVRNLSKGQRSTILDLSGSGSVRHMWSTWSIPENESLVAPRRVLLRVFVDGAAAPSVSGPIDDLCRAAEATGTRYLPLPAFNYKGAFNLYLPIYFKRHIRMEIEALGPMEEFYAQIDYRVTPRPERSARLISRRARAGLVLEYTGKDQPHFHASNNAALSATTETKDLRYNPTANAELVVNGPAVIRQISFQGDFLEDLELQMYWNGELKPSVSAPLRYFFADFVNAAMESTSHRMTCYFRMPFRKRARVVLRSLSRRSGRVRVEYVLNRETLQANPPYFRAEYRNTQQTLGYLQYVVLRTHGAGLFVGVNLFDTGHNHGGGDSALIDAGTSEPVVLHGICGEDYFSFAWHHTGTMTLLTGAPVHTRRYRLHLENPYPFRESFQFLFGMFAGLHPKSVAFWYEFPPPAAATGWMAPDVPWRVLGPVGLDTAVPERGGPEPLRTTVALKEPMLLEEHWQSVDMASGFLDLTYQFRHYTMTSSGTGFVAGSSRTKLVTYISSPSQEIVAALIGHDDQALVALNGEALATFPGHTGFGASRCSLPLRQGWNTLQVTLSNEENTNWRWCGLSLAFSTPHAQELRFSSQRE